MSPIGSIEGRNNQKLVRQLETIKILFSPTHHNLSCHPRKKTSSHLWGIVCCSIWGFCVYLCWHFLISLYSVFIYLLIFFLNFMVFFSLYFLYFLHCDLFWVFFDLFKLIAIWFSLISFLPHTYLTLKRASSELTPLGAEKNKRVVSVGRLLFSGADQTIWLTPPIMISRAP